MSVGAQSVREDIGIQPIILRSGRRVPVPEAVELLGVEGVDVQAPL